MKSTISFLLAFALGAIIALATRAALHEPHAAADTTVAGADFQPMVDNKARTGPAHDHGAHDHQPAASAPAHEHAPQPDADEQQPAADPSKPVNTICAICGMDVDPSLPTATYQGKTIGFGCPACPPMFKGNPDKYGPAYLRNERVKR